MFETISRINWGSLKTAHGYAGNVPEAIKGLTSEDYSICESSYWKLDNHIVLHSDLFESAFSVIPFLVEILQSNHLIGRSFVYDLLFEIANGYAPDDVVCIINNQETSLVDGCRSVISKEIPLFLNEVSNELSKCRTDALDLLISLNEERAQIIPALSSFITNEEDGSEFNLKLIEAIGELKE